MSPTEKRRPEGIGTTLTASTADPIVAQASATNNGDTFQPMPELNPEEYAALRESIASNGVIVPIVVDQHGRIIDGHHRVRIAAELSIEYPTHMQVVANDDEAMDLAVTLNCDRRHLTREQVREVIANEIRRRPEDSDRAIARRVGCSHTTVATVRAGRVAKLATSTTMTVEEAREITAAAKMAVAEVRGNLAMVAVELLSNGITAAEIITSLMRAQRRLDRAGQDVEGLHRLLLDPVVDWLLDPVTADEWRPQWDHPTFKPLTDDERTTAMSAFDALVGWSA